MNLGGYCNYIFKPTSWILNSRNHKIKKQAVCISLLSVLKTESRCINVVIVAPPGLEPGISEPKSGVLPLHHGAKACAKIAKTK